MPPKPTAATSAARILVIGNLHDPATPYQGAVDLAKTLGNAEVLTWDGEGHTSYLEGSYVHRRQGRRLPGRRHAARGGNDVPAVTGPRAVCAVGHAQRAARPGRWLSSCTAGGRTAPPRRTDRQLAVLRMLPFATALHRAGGAHGLAVARLRYELRGWNGDRRSPVRDAERALEQLSSRFPDVPVALVGHSMGGRAAVYAAGYDGVRAVVGLAPWIGRRRPGRAAGGPARAHRARHARPDDQLPQRPFALRERAGRVADAVTFVSVEGGRHAMLRRAAVWHSLVSRVRDRGAARRARGLPTGTAGAADANVMRQALAGTPRSSSD